MKRMSVFAGLMLLALSSAAQASDAIANWAAPSTWTPPSTQATGRSALVAYPPLPFVPLSPCRLADIRAGSGFPAGYGPPAIPGGGVRNFTITGQCGIPAGAQAVSFNFAVWAPTTRGDLRAYPAGVVPVPVVSTMNWEAGILALANAAVVPLGTAGAITVKNDGTTPLEIFVDVNGYYGSSVGTQTFTINSSSYYSIVGTSTIGFGVIGFGTSGGTMGINIGGASGKGVLGTGNAGIGVLGTSTSNIGVKGVSTNVNGVWAESTTQDGLFASGGRDGAFILGARNGVIANSTGTGSALYGVAGGSASTTAGSAGGFFVDQSGGPAGLSGGLPGTMGVIGASSTGVGVLGVVGSAFAAVGGLRLSSTTPFTMRSAGWLGWSNPVAGFFEGDVVVTPSAGGAGNLTVTGSLSKGAGTFKIDHPLDPANKYLYHSFVESPDMMNIYNGIIELDALGEAIVRMPAYFEALNSDFRYQLTSIGRPQSNLYIADEVQDLRFRIAGGKPHARVSWQVTGIRKDPFANANRVIPEVEKEPQAKGFYLHPAAYKQPAEKDLMNHVAATEKAEAQEQAKRNDR